MRIAIVKLSAMGDIIHAAVVLQFIKRSFPGSKIDWIVEECFAPLLKNNPDIDNIYPVSLKRFKKTRGAFGVKNFSLIFENINMLRSLGEYDYIIDMQGLFKSALISRLIGKNVCGFDKNSTRESIATLFYKNNFEIPYGMNVIMRGIRLVEKSLNISIDEEEILNKKPFLFSDDNSTREIDEYLANIKELIVVIVGASWKSKIYPAELMAEAIENLGKNVYLVWGSEEEERMAKEIAALTKFAKKARRFSITELIAFISKAKLVIGADTGPTHIAWALNIPSLAIFGPTPYFRNTMRTDINRTIDSGKKIDPCNLDKNDFCIKDIAPQDIAKMAKEMLKDIK